MQNITTELVGYIASALVLISFLFKDIFKLRVVNTMGCVVFIIYGAMLHTSWPVILTNASIIIINSYYMIQANRLKTRDLTE